MILKLVYERRRRPVVIVGVSGSGKTTLAGWVRQ
jgi:adenylate kinase